MPTLLHLNGEMNKINKRINKAALKQASASMPDVPPPAVNEDITINYTSLMKSLSNILINLQEIYMSKFSQLPEGETDYFDLPDLPDVSELTESTGISGISGMQSLRSNPSQASSVSSGFSYAPIGSVGSRGSAHRGGPPSIASSASSGQPFYRRGSQASSVYSQPQSQILSSLGVPSSRYSQPQDSLGNYPEPRRHEESILSAQRGPNSFSSLLLNSLNREIINAKFLTEEINFGLLTKIQKEKLIKIMVRIDKVKRIISTGVSKPIYVNLNSVLKMIQSGLSSEGSASEFLLRTEGTMPPEQAGEIEAIGSGRVGYGHISGSTTSVYGASRKHRLLSPAMFNAHNVNDNFVFNLQKRNN
jgi:hypothetical protein